MRAAELSVAALIMCASVQLVCCIVLHFDGLGQLWAELAEDVDCGMTLPTTAGEYCR
jgi:hypothetical protein